MSRKHDPTTEHEQEAILLGRNDAANGPFPYRTALKLGEPEEDREYFPVGIPVVKSEEHGKFGTRTGRNE